MSRAERFSPRFLADLGFAVEHYDSISSATGNRFRDNLDSRLDLIMSTPEGFAEVYDSVRAVRVRTYPYVILYEVFIDHVDFIALVHGAGSRENWFEKI